MRCTCAAVDNQTFKYQDTNEHIGKWKNKRREVEKV